MERPPARQFFGSFKKPILGRSNYLFAALDFVLRFGPYSRTQITSGLFDGHLDLYRYNPLSLYPYVTHHPHLLCIPSFPDTLVINPNSKEINCNIHACSHTIEIWVTYATTALNPKKFNHLVPPPGSVESQNEKSLYYFDTFPYTIP